MPRPLHPEAARAMPRVVQLLRDNAARPRNYRVENANQAEATIYVYDVIGMDFWTGEGVTAINFAADLSQISAKTVHLRINSPGGDVFEARAIVAAMRDKQASGTTFIAHVDGYAASAASVIAVNADQTLMADGSFLMIHNAWTMAVGDKNDMTTTAALLAKIDQTIAADYAKKSGASNAQITEWMDAETWFTAAEAVTAGLANTAEAGTSASNSTQWNFSAYENAPVQVALTPEADETETPDYSDLLAANLRHLSLLERASP